MRQLLFTTIFILFAIASTSGQQEPDRKSAGTTDTARTVRTELRRTTDQQFRRSYNLVYTTILDDKGQPLESAEYLPGGSPDIRFMSTYDERGNEIEYRSYVHDELSFRRTTKYDERNRKVEEISFDRNGKQTDKFIFNYDRRGRRITTAVNYYGVLWRKRVAKLDARGNELERTEYKESGGVDGRYVYTFDVAGRKTSETHFYKADGRSQSSKHTYAFDIAGNLIAEALYFDDVLKYKKTYKRDARGNLEEELETDSKGQIREKRTWSYEFGTGADWTRAVVTELNNLAPVAQRESMSELRREFGTVNIATVGLWNAAREGDLSCVEESLRSGAEIDAKHPGGTTSLIKAAGDGNQEIVQLLLNKGAAVDGKDAEGWSALMWAAEFGRIEIVKLLLTAKADPNARNNLDAVAIMPASSNGHTEVVKLLIEKGAEADIAAVDGSTALMVAAENGNTEVMKLLLEKGADPNKKMLATGSTALFAAALANKIDAVKLLLEKGAEVNARLTDGTTPLMFAAFQDSPEVLEILIEKGADVSAKSDNGKTALSFAIEADKKDAVEILKKAGAK